MIKEFDLLLEVSDLIEKYSKLGLDISEISTIVNSSIKSLDLEEENKINHKKINIKSCNRGYGNTHEAISRVKFLNDCGVKTCLVVSNPMSKQYTKMKAQNSFKYFNLPVFTIGEKNEISKYSKAVIDNGTLCLEGFRDIQERFSLTSEEEKYFDNQVGTIIDTINCFRF